MSSGGGKHDRFEVLVESAKKRVASGSSAPHAKRKASEVAPKSVALSAASPITIHSVAVPVDATSVSRLRPSPLSVVDRGITVYFPEGFGDPRLRDLWPNMDKLLFPPATQEYDALSPEEVVKANAMNAFMSLQFALHTSEIVRRARTENLAVSAKNQELTNNCVWLREERDNLRQRIWTLLSIRAGTRLASIKWLVFRGLQGADKGLEEGQG